MSYCCGQRLPCSSSACRTSCVSNCYNASYDPVTLVLSDTTPTLLNDAGVTFAVPCDSCVNVTFSGTAAHIDGQADVVAGIQLGVYNVLAGAGSAQWVTNYPQGLVSSTVATVPFSATNNWDLSAGTYVFLVRVPADADASVTASGQLSVLITRKAV